MLDFEIFIKFYFMEFGDFFMGGGVEGKLKIENKNIFLFL